MLNSNVPAPSITQPTIIIGRKRNRVTSQPPTREKSPDIRNVMLAPFAMKVSATEAFTIPVATNSSLIGL